MLTQFRNPLNKLPGKVVELTFERLRRYEGSWHKETLPLFPNHILIESTDKSALEKYLHCSDDELSPVSLAGENLLRELCDPKGNLQMSCGVIHKGITHVTEGPLKGKEEIIRKIDRHKRLATLDLPMVGDVKQLKVGLEIVEKTV